MNEQLLQKILSFLLTDHPTLFTKDEEEQVVKTILEYIYSNEWTKEEWIGDGDSESPSQTINDFADMQDIDFDNHQNYEFWNESLQSLFDHGYFKNYDQDGKFKDDAIIFFREDGKKYPLKEIINADAGYDFSDLYVKPLLNWNKKKYKDVRGNADLFKRAAQSGKNLQRTSIPDTTIRKWLSLLMPCNTRRVEVEDLNRNFWVIGQTTSLLCSYIFDETDGSLADLFRRILSELSQLWENTIFLWVLLDIISKNEVKNTIVKFIHLPESSILTSRKYDKTYYDQDIIIPSDSGKEKIIERLQFLKDQYSNANLCFFVYILDNNYYQNYNSAFQLLGVYFYNRITLHENFIYAKSPINFDYIKDLPDPVQDAIEDAGGITRIDMNHLGDDEKKLYTVREEDMNYKVAWPLSSINSFVSEKPQYMYSLLRFTPQLEVNYEDNKITVKNAEITFNDVARKLYLNEDETILKINLENEVNEESQEINLNITTQGSDLKTISYPVETFGWKGYYSGETISCRRIPSFAPTINTYQFIGLREYSADGMMIKIGNFLNDYIAEGNVVSKYPFYQVTNEGSNGYSLTGYALNLTYRCYHGGFQSPSKCKYYIPYFTGESPEENLVQNHSKQWNYNYGLIEYAPEEDSMLGRSYSYAEVTKEFLKKNAFALLKVFFENDQESNYNIENLIANKKIIHAFTAIGLDPWENGQTKNQGYWEQNMITHLVVYLPESFVTEDLKNQNECIEIEREIDNVNYTGYIFILSENDFKDQNFPEAASGTVVYSMYEGTNKDENDRWRLPKIYSTPAQSSLLQYQINEDITKDYWAILTEEYYQMYLLDPDSIIPYLENGIIKTYDTQDEAKKHLGEEIVNTPSGIWSVFDGYTKNDSSLNPNDAIKWENIRAYNSNNSFRQIAEMYFQFKDGEALIFDVIGRERYNLNNAKKLKYLSWSEETGEGKVSTWRTRYDRVKKVCSTFVQDGKYHAITLNYEGDINQNLKDHKLDEELIWASTANNWKDGHVTW